MAKNTKKVAVPKTKRKVSGNKTGIGAYIEEDIIIAGGGLLIIVMVVFILF